MSFPIVRQGDTNSAGGRALIPRDQVKSSNKPLAAFSSKISPHPCCGRPGCTIHCAASITGGSSTVKAQGKPVHKVSDGNTCGHTMSRGDNKVLVLK